MDTNGLLDFHIATVHVSMASTQLMCDRAIGVDFGVAPRAHTPPIVEKRQ